MHKGNCNGKILVIQDAPSESDLEQGVPFTGPLGWKLKKWIEDNGISIDDIMFCNLDYYIHVDLASIQVIVPLGEKSTEYLLPGYPKLNKIRGSIYYKDRIKIIPSLHPKDVIFNTQWEYRCRADWKKIKGELENGIYEPPIRNHNITPDLTDIKDFYDSLGHTSALSMDIETWGGTIKCIGFAANERESLVIPTEESYWKKRTGDELDIHNAWDLIQLICTHPCAKIMQNGLFDAWWLLEYGIGVENYIYDTLAMHHALWPRDNHSLDYLASLYTRQPYWKDEAKDADEIVRVAKQGMERLYVYNGLDVTVTWEIWQKLQTELMEVGLIEFYKTHYAELFYPLLSLMRRGISVDRRGMDALRVRLLEDALSLRDRASQLAERPLFVFDKTKAERDALEWYLRKQRICEDSLKNLE